VKVGQGIDIVEVRRIRETVARQGARFVKRVFHPVEVRYCEGRRMKFEHYAARFAAKEAAIKALAGLVPAARDLPLREIQVRKRATGQPYFHFAPAVRKKFRFPKGLRLELSLAHERQIAIASAVAICP
jgi:holo-[acyl-carrier protein] synthase